MQNFASADQAGLRSPGRPAAFPFFPGGYPRKRRERARPVARDELKDGALESS